MQETKYSQIENLSLLQSMLRLAELRLERAEVELKLGATLRPPAKMVIQQVIAEKARTEISVLKWALEELKKAGVR